MLLNCILLFLFCLLEQIEVLFSWYEQYLLLLSTIHMYIDSLERRAAEIRGSFTCTLKLQKQHMSYMYLSTLFSIYSSCFL